MRNAITNRLVLSYILDWILTLYVLANCGKRYKQY